MINLHRLISWLFPDRRPDWEQKREREFIQVANSLKTLRVTPEGGMSIDPEELRDQIVAAREQLKHLVHKPVTTSRPSTPIPCQEASPIAEAPSGALDCIEVVAWRRLPSGAAVRYTCLQHFGTGRFIVSVASLFSEDAESLPRWIDSDTQRQVACALQSGGLQWHATLTEAMDAWDAGL
ncbi:hypothetical protein BTW15_20095 [Pseudomonas syringae pv. tomato]|uniref:Uncharacterized protein n=1 Tax=Pseudomonas syringae pv. tomato TaxID=323 RepID=A0AB36KNH0_PSEUB|nr:MULTISPECIES: hypothetical protein [Pseudomonas syringae group]MBI6846238.1 hypothetical protein [Pseudomonas syringae]MBX6512143.1 hypothetical protein [Pseudomonas syringae pv. tomato]OPE58236.1 hypothetical protein BTW15_20095 [Pseudomonas syringae pv. tomato]TES56399.1 hypothetical protein E2N91_18900 [Pseudomonas syringae pv. tomato]TES76145.1 hypothetical protein E2N89_19115 [Pseudomonas syringae pv. tomato]